VKALLPIPAEVQPVMNRLTSWVREREAHLSGSDADYVVALACDLHYALVHVHPFVDGNGRTARLLDSLILNRHGFPPIVLSEAARDHYLSTMNDAVEKHDHLPFCQFHMDALITSADRLSSDLESGC
jgi:Fic family protein